MTLRPQAHTEVSLWTQGHSCQVRVGQLRSELGVSKDVKKKSLQQNSPRAQQIKMMQAAVLARKLQQTMVVLCSFHWFYGPASKTCQVYQYMDTFSILFQPFPVPLSLRLLDPALLQTLPIHFIFILNLQALRVHQPHPVNVEGSARYACSKQETQSDTITRK